MHASDRGILVGASRTGKSTLAEYVLRMFRLEYPDGRIAVFDTKPRWRAERLYDGRSARRMYAAFARGDTIAGSVACTDLSQWSMCWDRDANPSQTVIFQRVKGLQVTNVNFQVRAAEKLFATQRASRPTLAYFDEGMDFFSATGGAKGGSDIVQRMYRSGGEKGLATLLGMQRPVGITLQTMTDMNWAALFPLRYAGDVKRLYDMGWPQDAPPPAFYNPKDGSGDPKGTFRHYREGATTAPKYRLQQRSMAA